MRFKISFDLIENIEKQEKDFGVTEEQKKYINENKEQFLKQHIGDIKKEILELFSFQDYEYVENLEVTEVE